MKEPTLHEAKITGGFWKQKLQLTTEIAIYYQWDQLEKTHCIDNFRIAAGLIEGFRERFFFADSDSYKWLDAASRLLVISTDPHLIEIVDEFIKLLTKAQQADGYLYTYNQIHFPGHRWVNLQLEHEFYCMGHLIEACVSHFQTTGKTILLGVGVKIANLLVREFLDAPPLFTDGHEEIEIALLKLWKVTGERTYLKLAQEFLSRRGRIKRFGWHFLQQSLSTSRRMKKVSELRKKFDEENKRSSPNVLPDRNLHKTPLTALPRLLVNLVSGKYSQQNLPLENQTIPIGHAVRFTYLQTAAAMVARATDNNNAAATLSLAWEHMVSKRMYVTGGVGSLPLIEGFGRDYELHPEIAYAETCAALGSMFWSHEMALLTGNPCYSDLFEWQLYNAASVGIGLDGCSYFYNNPLISRGEISRAGWYDIPCCPSNLSREWASLATQICSYDENAIQIHQYITSEIKLELVQPITLLIESGLPWDGNVKISFQMREEFSTTLSMRLPAWCEAYQVTLNDVEIETEVCDFNQVPKTASGLDFFSARLLNLKNTFQPGDEIHIHFSMPIKLHQQDKRVPNVGGMVAISRGPIVYCLENLDNDGDIFKVNLDSNSLHSDYDVDLFGGTWVIKGLTTQGERLTWIPYMLWGNRGKSKMTVFVKD